MPGENLTRAEAAEVLGVSARWLEKAAVTGGGPPFVRLSRRTVRYPRAELERWMAARLVENTGQADANDELRGLRL
jgi:excisionase family DNA binding protein